MIAAALVAVAFGTSAVGQPVTQLARAYGTPAAVASTDTGHRFAFARPGGTELDAWVDDDGVVRALDVRGGSGDTFAATLDGKERIFTFGSYALPRAEADLASVADTANGTVRTYRGDDRRELVLSFEGGGATLGRLVYGERPAVARLGFLPGDHPERTTPYVAPKLRGTRVPDGTGARAVIVRETVDRSGAVTDASVLIPSGDPAFDTSVVKLVAQDRYLAATLGGRAIGATVYREIRG